MMLSMLSLDPLTLKTWAQTQNHASTIYRSQDMVTNKCLAAILKIKMAATSQQGLLQPDSPMLLVMLLMDSLTLKIWIKTPKSRLYEYQGLRYVLKKLQMAAIFKNGCHGLQGPSDFWLHIQKYYLGHGQQLCQVSCL